MNRELLGLLIVVVSWACNPTPPAEAGEADPKPQVEATAPAPKADLHADKITPPAEVALRTDGTTGRVVATAEITATGNLPRVVARFVVPAGVTLVEGTAEVEVGKLAAGEKRSLTVTLEVPAEGRFLLAAGADLFMEPGIKLHRSTTTDLGDGTPDTPVGKVVRPPGGTRIRLSPARRR